MPVSDAALLPLAWRKEDFSLAYVMAIAVSAGVTWTELRRDINSCDVLFEGRDDDQTDGPAVRVQLKCTESGLTTSPAHPEAWRFVLKGKNYRELRIVPAHPPRLLVVVRCPGDPGDWVRLSPTELVLSAEAWWVDLQGEPALANGEQSITVSIPQAQRFDTSALLANMCSCP
ncbi:MAG: DUF4365 domain-containing protein [Actinomycetota bacterium]|nr:DUF4365 domain-containing protein [Actinomycetota bacterium]